MPDGAVLAVVMRIPRAGSETVRQLAGKHATKSCLVCIPTAGSRCRTATSPPFLAGYR